MRENKGITLIALIITIIIMLILVAITINIVVQNEVFNTAKLATRDYKNAAEGEAGEIDRIVNEAIARYVDQEPQPLIIKPDTEGMIWKDSANTPKDPSTDSLEHGDIVVFGDYTYIYSAASYDFYGMSLTGIDGWSVTVTDRNKTNYSQIATTILGKQVKSLSSTFSNCTNLETAPHIPNSITDMQRSFQGCTSLKTVSTLSNNVTNMQSTFYGCTSLETVPNIPNSVTNMQSTFQDCRSLETAPTISNHATNMQSTFQGCTSLETAPVIPESVTYIDYAFSNCTSLTGLVTINAANLTLTPWATDVTTTWTFAGTVLPIVLTGSCPNLEIFTYTGGLDSYTPARYPNITIAE